MMWLAQILLGLPAGADAAKVDFRTEVLPILEARCFECHRDPAANAGKRPKGGLRLDGKQWILKGTEFGPIIAPGEPAESALFELISLDADDPDRMPPKGDALKVKELETIRLWILEGATFGDWVGAPGPGEKSESTPKPKPPGKIPKIVLLYMELGEGLSPHTEEQIKLAAGERGTIQPVFPGSPLLSVGFPSNQGRTGTADVRGLMCCAGNVVTLDLGRTRITNEALEAVENMPRLVKLDLRQTNITDEAIVHIAKLDNLRSLNLFSVAVTDKSIDTIAGLKKLETVYLWQSKVTKAGVARLRAIRPDLRVVDQADLPAPEVTGQGDGDTDGRRRRR